MCSLLAKKLGVQNTIARIRNPEYNESINLLKKELGLSMTINPELLTANKVSQALSIPSALDVTSCLKGKIDVISLRVKNNSILIGKTLEELRKRLKNNILICAIEREEKVIIPNGNTTLQINDKLYITGKRRDINIFLRYSGIISNKTKKVIIGGGSDITGAIVARAVEADIYENWTDVSGVMFEDPRVVEIVPTIEYITYTELRELSYMGANVLHEETVYPVSKVGIPINILNTNSPRDKGTMIMHSIPSIVKRRVVTGIAGKKGFTSILLQKTLMNEEVGFVARLLRIFEKEKISVEHCPTGIDTISIVVRSELLKEKEDIILDEIKKELKPEVLNVEEGLSIIAIVGEGMVYHKEITFEIFKCLHEANIGVKMIDLGSSGINVIIGVNDSDYEKTLIALKVLSDVKV